LENKPTKFGYIFIISSGLILSGFLIQDAYAYIDPGSGSIFIQAIIGALVGFGVAIRVYWEKIKSKLLRKH
jgi:hypothetical protein